MKNRLVFVGLSFLSLLTACSSAPPLNDYSRAEIDRPYTLPKGVATWKTVIPFGSFKDNTGSFFLPPIPVPLFWQTSLSDSWTLNWLPLPLSISHQLNQTKDQVTGATFGLGFGYASSIGLLLNPSLAFYHRQKMGENWALELTPNGSLEYMTKGADPIAWTVGLGVGPLFQLTPTFAARPKVSVVVAYGSRNTVSLSDVNVTPEKRTQFTVPLGLDFTWSFDRQWDLGFGYKFHRIGYTRDYTAHIGWVQFVHYW